MATIRVHTTQNVTIEYEAASIGDRIVAALLDDLILFAWVMLWVLIITKVVSGSHNGSTADPSGIGRTVGIIILLLLASPVVFYHLACEVLLNGQSLGKKARNLRVIRLDGTSPRFGDYLLRWLLRIVDTGIGSGLIAMVTIAATGTGQRLGDLAAGTTVVNLRPKANQMFDLNHLATSAAYQPVFPQAAQLSDHDVALLRQLLHRSMERENYILLNETATKIKMLLGIQSDMSDHPFLQTILRDHAHLLMQG